MRTVNVQCASAARPTAEAQCAAIEAARRKHYNKYDRSFAPFVTTLSGAVSQASAEALMRVLKAVARGDRNVMDWEPARWMEDILHRLAVEMVTTVAVATATHATAWTLLRPCCAAPCTAMRCCIPHVVRGQDPDSVCPRTNPPTTAHQHKKHISTHTTQHQNTITRSIRAPSDLETCESIAS